MALEIEIIDSSYVTITVPDEVFQLFSGEQRLRDDTGTILTPYQYFEPSVGSKELGRKFQEIYLPRVRRNVLHIDDRTDYDFYRSST